MHRSPRGPWSLLVLALAVSPVSATILSPLSDHALTDRAHVIVIGRATARQTAWIGGHLATLVTVAVDESVKGDAGATVTVALPGGIDRRRKVPIEVFYVGAPQIGAGEHVLLFLERGAPHVAGAYVVSGLARGKLSIRVDVDGVKWVSRGGGGGRRVERLSDLRDAIRWHLQGGRP
jgi:hypothetical protein